MPDFPGYEVSDAGNVRSWWNRSRSFMREPKLLTPNSSTRYLRVAMRRDDRAHHWCVHALVLTVFVGPRPDGMQCRHLDGNGHNNALVNLAWGTAKENCDDKVRHGRMPSGDGHPSRTKPWALERGESHYKAKFTEAVVVEMRALHAGGMRLADIARRFGANRGSVSRIVRRLEWRHVA